MSAPKSVAKRQKLNRQRKRKQESRLRHKRKQHGVREERFSFGFDAPAGVSMSDVLEQFVEPFEDLTHGEEAYRCLLTLGVLAWNAALASGAKLREMIEDVIRERMPEDDEELQTYCREIVGQFVERKERYFAQYRRPILNFVLMDMGDQYHLTVMSAVV